MDEYKFERAWSAHQRGQHKQAISMLKELLSIDPNEAMYHGVLAACLLAEKRLSAAEYELNIAMQLDPLKPFLILTNARILIFNKKLNLVLEACDDVLASDAESIDALLLKATIYSLMDKNDARKTCIEQALAISPDNTNTLCAMGEFYRSNGKLSEAFECASDALNKNAQDDEANILMGKISLAKGDIEAANYHATFSIMQNPSSTEALTLFSHIKMRKNLFLGLWWRVNTKISTMGNLKSSLILIIGFLFFNFLSQVLKDLDFPTAASVSSVAWLALVAYSWICIPLYYKKLKQELQKFQFNPRF